MASVLNDGGVGMLSDPSDAMRSRREAESIYVCYEYDDAEIAELIPARQPDSNKGTYGKVLIIAGSKDIYGAVYMAAEAAYRVGAGLVKVVTDIRNRDTLCEKLPEAMLLTYDTEKTEDGFIDDFKASVKWADIILCGPGIGTGDMAVKLMELLADFLSEGQKLILDADALNVMATGASRKWWEEYISKVGTGNVIITPHMMEMLRLIKSGYDTRTFDFMIKNLGYGSEMDFLKDYMKTHDIKITVQ